MNNVKLFFITILITTSLLSCSDSILNEPIKESNSTEFQIFQKGGNPLTQHSVTQTINGNVGGVINLTAIQTNFGSNPMHANATLIIPAGAFQGIQEITVTADFSEASFYFEPSMVFDMPLLLTSVFTGLDLTALNLLEDVIFAYIDDNGNVTPCINDSITINPPSGMLRVIRAEIEHFSRYGFSR